MESELIPSFLEMEWVRGKRRPTNERQARHQTIHRCLSVILKKCLGAQTVKHLPAMWETRVPSLGWEDPLEKELATHSSMLAWKISWREEPGGMQSMGSQRVGHNWETNTYLLTYLFNPYAPLKPLTLTHSPESLLWLPTESSELPLVHHSFNNIFIYTPASELLQEPESECVQELCISW